MAALCLSSYFLSPQTPCGVMVQVFETAADSVAWIYHKVEMFWPEVILLRQLQNKCPGYILGHSEYVTFVRTWPKEWCMVYYNLDNCKRGSR